MSAFKVARACPRGQRQTDAGSRVGWYPNFMGFTEQLKFITFLVLSHIPLIIRVSFTVTFTQHNDSNIYTISQEKFFRAANVNDTEIERRKAAQRDYSWMLPLSYQTNLRDFQPQFHILNKSQSKQIM